MSLVGKAVKKWSPMEQSISRMSGGPRIRLSMGGMFKEFGPK